MTSPIKEAVLAAIAKCEASEADGVTRTFAFKQLGTATRSNLGQSVQMPVFAIAGVEYRKGGKPKLFVTVDVDSDLARLADPKSDEAGVFAAGEIELDEEGYLTDAGQSTVAAIQNELNFASGLRQPSDRFPVKGLYPETQA